MTWLWVSLGIYGFGYAVAYVYFVISWLDHFGDGDVLNGGIWSLFAALFWPVVALGLVGGLAAQLLAKRLLPWIQ